MSKWDVSEEITWFSFIVVIPLFLIFGLPYLARRYIAGVGYFQSYLPTFVFMSVFLVMFYVYFREKGGVLMEVDERGV